MSTALERREEMYKKGIAWLKAAITYTRSVLNDQYESNLYHSVIEKQTKVPNDNPNPNTVVAEIGEQFTVVLSQDGVREVDSSFSVLKKELAHAYTKHDISLWDIHLKI